MLITLIPYIVTDDLVLLTNQCVEYRIDEEILLKMLLWKLIKEVQIIYLLQGTILDLILLVFVLKTIFRWCYFSTNILKMVEKLGI